MTGAGTYIELYKDSGGLYSNSGAMPRLDVRAYKEGKIRLDTITKTEQLDDLNTKLYFQEQYRLLPEVIIIKKPLEEVNALLEKLKEEKPDTVDWKPFSFSQEDAINKADKAKQDREEAKAKKGFFRKYFNLSNLLKKIREKHICKITQ